jgi:FkbM family methyltransferase
MIFYPKNIEKISKYVENLNYLDIGFRGGVSGWFKLIESKLNVIGFEAEINEGLFNCKGEKILYVTSEKSQSSLFKPNPKQKIFENEETRLNYTEQKIKVDTLDNKLKDFQKKIDLIKIDTQGSEYEILEGGFKTISKDMPFLFLETWSHPYYENIKLFDEIIYKLRTIGYEIYLLDTAATKHINIKNKFIKNVGQQKMNGFNLFLGPSIEYIMSEKTIQERVKRSFVFQIHDLLTFSYKIVENDDHEYKSCLEKIIKNRKKYSYFYNVSKYFTLIKSQFFKSKNIHPLT